MNYSYAWRVTFTYRMKDGIAGPEGTEYTFTHKPYQMRSFKTYNNAVRALLREGWAFCIASPNMLIKEHVCTGKNPVTESFPVWATIT